MKLIATIDYWDDTPGRVVDIHPESVKSFAMLFTNRNVASVTLTRPPDLVRLAEGGKDNE